MSSMAGAAALDRSLTQPDASRRGRGPVGRHFPAVLEEQIAIDHHAAAERDRAATELNQALERVRALEEELKRRS